ncbi:MAG: hypothetical protein N3G21_09725 [Candidatus Hydrogenedentes bacterium]|nr:hypothetical protein [Candidatus Hydrogenedentota bacterium]
MATRREFLQQLTSLSIGLPTIGFSQIPPFTMGDSPVPVVDITDLYHPPQDFGDTFDLIFPYAVPEVSLKGILFDVTHRYRVPYPGEGENQLYSDPLGGREPGVITVWQLNYLFDKAVPSAPCTFEPLASQTDTQLTRGEFENQGLTLLMTILEKSSQPVEVVSFGSARPLALAINRFPDLLRKKVSKIHLCAGSYPPGELLEWNVKLDPEAFIRVISTDLPIIIYPCAERGNAFALGNYNTYWLMPNLEFLKDIDPRLLRFLVYSHSRSNRVDFLQVLEEEPPEDATQALLRRAHNVWETDVWLEVSKRVLVQRADASYRIILQSEKKVSDRPVPTALVPVRLIPKDDGNFEVDFDADKKPHKIFYRRDPDEHQRAMREAIPELYKSFKSTYRKFQTK